MAHEEIELSDIKQFDGDEYVRMRKEAHQLCKRYLHGAWCDVLEEEFVILKVGGGLSNLLYYCALPEGVSPTGKEPSRALLRIYGNTLDNGIEMHLTECIVFTMLSESQSGPRLYGIFPGGRLEQYIPGRHLVTDELLDDDLSSLIAEAFAQIHSMCFPLPKEPTWLWTTFYRWVSTIESVFNADDTAGLNVEMVETLRKTNLRGEVNWLENFLSCVHSPVVFCHNDLQEGNILLKCSSDANKKSIVLIDFEYAAYNHRGFDLANHLCETMYDYSNEQFPYFWAKPQNFPSKEKQMKFAERYLCKYHKVNTISESEVEHLFKEIDAFILASHMFWAVWSVVMACSSTIEFDYWGYCEARLAAYYAKKETFISEQWQYGLNIEKNCNVSNASPPPSLIEIS